MKVVIIIGIFLIFIQLVISARYPLIPKAKKVLSTRRIGDSECYANVKCIAKGKSCSTENGLCDSGLYCAKDTGTCEPLLPNGAPCQEDDFCASTICNDVGVCSDPIYIQPGQKCDYDSGSTFCVIQAECVCNDVGYNNCSCVAYPTLGQPCSIDFGCAGASTCSVEKLMCVELFSIPPGGLCATEVDCITGLYCNGSGVCQEPFKGSGKPCNSSSSCEDPNEECQCNGYTPGSQKVCVAPFVSSQSDATKFKAIAKCVQNKKCKDIAYSKNGKVEICPVCKAQVCDYFSHIVDPYDHQQPSCMRKFEVIHEHCKPSHIPGWGIALIVLAVVGVVGVIVVVVYRKRHSLTIFNYSNIPSRQQ